MTRTIRTWHRRIALVLGLFLVFQGVTGAIAQYRYNLLGAFEPAYSAPADGPQATPGEIVATLERELDGFHAAHVMYPADEALDTAVLIMGAEHGGPPMSRMVTVDQYRDTVLSDRPVAEATGWIGLATSLHKWTLFGTAGRIVLTIVGLCAVAIAVLGLWLAWRMRGSPARGALARWHRRAGVVTGVVLLITASAGTALNLFGWYEKEAGLLVTSANREAALAGPVSAPTIALDEAFATARSRVGPIRLAAFSTPGAHARDYWFAFTDSRLRRTDVLVSPTSGAIIGVKPSGLVCCGGGLRGWLYPLHVGFWLGPVGGAITALMGATLIFWFVSGVVLWQRARPRKRKRRA